MPQIVSNSDDCNAAGGDKRVTMDRLKRALHADCGPEIRETYFKSSRWVDVNHAPGSLNYPLDVRSKEGSKRDHCRCCLRQVAISPGQ